MKTNPATKYITELQKRGPAAWAQGAHGWIDTNGNPVVLEPWQAAILGAWFDRRADVTTLAISNIKKTGKTFVNAVLLAWRWLALPSVHFAAGNDLDQSQARQFSEITDMVRRNPFLSENVRISKSELEFTLTGSKLIALAADAAGNAGANHATTSHTESWGILYEAGIRSWEELTPPPTITHGLPALRIADSYAGFIGESQTWHKLVDRGLSGERVSDEWLIYQHGGLLLFHAEGTEAQERCFRGTDAQRQTYYNEQAESLRPHAFDRMHRNIRTSGESAFVSAEQWQACFSYDIRPLQPNENVQLVLGADASQKHDYTALIGVQRHENLIDVRFVKVWKPRKFAGVQFTKAIDLEETIGAEVLRLHQAGNVRAVCFDPWQLATVAAQWTKAGIRCIEMPQTAQRTEADTALYSAIVSGAIRHYNAPELNEAVDNAVIAETSRGMRITKEKTSRKIDALVALSMAHHAALAISSAVTEFLPWSIWGDDNPADWIKAGGRWTYAPQANRAQHPKGVTWRNCKHRMKGCEACIAELEAEGYFQQQDEELKHSLARGAGKPLTESEANEELFNRLNLGWRIQKQIQQEADDAKIIENFKRATKLGG